MYESRGGRTLLYSLSLWSNYLGRVVIVLLFPRRWFRSFQTRSLNIFAFTTYVDMYNTCLKRLETARENRNIFLRQIIVYCFRLFCTRILELNVDLEREDRKRHKFNDQIIICEFCVIVRSLRHIEMNSIKQ